MQIQKYQADQQRAADESVVTVRMSADSVNDRVKKYDRAEDDGPVSPLKVLAFQAVVIGDTVKGR